METKSFNPKIVNSEIVPIKRIQPKLEVNPPNDIYEKQADEVADKVSRMPANSTDSLQMQPKEDEDKKLQMKPEEEASTLQMQPEDEDKGLQMKPEEDDSISMKSEEKEKGKIQMSSNSFGGQNVSQVSPRLASQLNSSKGQGSPLPNNVSKEMGQKIGGDFSKVRVHTDDNAVQMNKELGAKAFTHGNDIYFNNSNYNPDSSSGKHLLAHELTHVFQQNANSVIRRKKTKTLESVIKAQVGPVSGEGGLLNDTVKRYSVIIEQNDTLRSIATKLLPEWNSAQPFKPEGSDIPNPFTSITVEQLAKGLLVYNQYYLAVPYMTKWKVGLRFPLPIEVNQLTGERFLNPDLIALWAKSFDPKWNDLLDKTPMTTSKPSEKELSESVVTFLTTNSTSSSRGIALSAMAITNAIEAEPFFMEVIKQIGADSFSMALSFMDNLVNHQLQLLASQRAGMDIVFAIREIINNPPSNISNEQKESLERALSMLGKIGLFDAKKAEDFKQIYITKAYKTNCMVAVYKGLEALYSEGVSSSIWSQVYNEAAAYQKKKGVDTNTMDRLMETVYARGKAGPMVVFKYQNSSKNWNPDPEETILGMTNQLFSGWYFFGMSLHGAYHSVILAIDKTDLSNPQIYWMDQFTKGFTKNVTGALEDQMKAYEPSYGFEKTKIWQIIPSSDTLLEIH